MSSTGTVVPQAQGMDRHSLALPIPRDVAEAYDGVRAHVVARVDAALFRRPDLGVLLGDAPASVVRELNRHIAAFLACILTLGLPELVTRGLPRMLSAYLARGLSGDYLDVLPELWKRAIEDQMGVRSAPIVRVLEWMAEHPAAWVPIDAIPKAAAQEGGDRRLSEALLLGDGPGARSILRRAMDEGVTLPDVFVDLLQPALYEIGRQWEDGRITPAQEHIASALVARLLAGLEYASSDTHGRIAVVATAPTEAHEFGAWMAAEVLRAAGWTVHFLGSHTPVEECLHYLRGVPCDLLAVSVTLEIHLPSLQRLVAALRSDPELSGLPVLVGGQAFSGSERLWRAAGADGMALDARGLVAEADRLAPAPHRLATS
ncbi:MAG TPA: cobalamin-dependent protein [Longimicrobiales bacterium]|nr:cobalamin-dependent protein [Longimicrobiales bacterium]